MVMYKGYYRDGDVGLRGVWARGKVEQAIERRTRRHCMVDIFFVALAEAMLMLQIVHSALGGFNPRRGQPYRAEYQQTIIDCYLTCSA